MIYLSLFYVIRRIFGFVLFTLFFSFMAESTDLNKPGCQSAFDPLRPKMSDHLIPKTKNQDKFIPAVKASSSGNKFIIIDTRHKELPRNPNIQDHSYLIEKDLLDKISHSSLEERKEALDRLQVFLEESQDKHPSLDVKHFFAIESTSGQKVKISSRKTFDGVCILRSSKKYDLICDFYNRDGSRAELCGNATCALAFYEENLGGKDSLYFKLGEEEVRSFKKDNHYWIKFKEFESPKMNTVLFEGRNISYYFAKTGVPHAVLEWDASTLKLEEIESIARFLRKKGNTNVSFFRCLDKNSVKALSYERGVEGFTLSCGTGALATALTFILKTKNRDLKQVLIKMPGGDLRVQLKPDLALSSSPKLGY